MCTYRVFNENNALVEVTSQQLDEASAGCGELPTHLANAVGVARRRDLVDRLRVTLGAPNRRNKLAAARALLALDDREAAGLLRDRAAVEVDSIAASVFRGIALRLEGVEPVRRAFAEGDKDPAVASALALIYSGAFDLVPGDVELVLEMIAEYVSNKKSWIANMSRDDWRSDLYVLLQALSRGAALIADRVHAREVLSRVAASRADRDTKKEAQKILAQL